MMCSNVSISEALLEIEQQQCKQLSELNFNENVCYVYNPLDYAKETHEFYVRAYCNEPKKILFLGMNPGPFGMAQNGVPFGDSTFVNNWLKIKGNVFKPEKEHPKRPIQGLNCSRSEVSGSRFWSFIEETCGQPANFFQNCFVHNYCPISMMTHSAKNITPPELKSTERKALLDICDDALCRVVTLLQIQCIVGIGKFAEVRANHVLKAFQIPGVSVVGMMHPSPINPAANKGWRNIAQGQLESMGIFQFLTQH